MSNELIIPRLASRFFQLCKEIEPEDILTLD